MTTYPDSVRYLYSLGNEIRVVKLGLERIRNLLARLGDPQKAFRSVHIAGTNGKGSVAAMIASTLRAAGVRTGLYTSPHLVEPTERIQIDGVPVSAEQFAAAFDQVHRTAEQMYRRKALDMHPTYFETVTAMGFLLFRDLGVETAVLETGLGGRLDATNVVQPAISVITRIDYDHEAYLGHSLEAIAGEKAGILKSGAPAVIARQRPEAQRVLDDRARELGVRTVTATDWEVRDLELHPRDSRFRISKDGRELRLDCPLAGAHQVENAVAAAAALVELGIAPVDIERGIAATRWPGRLERVSQDPDIILDGAHNPSGIRALAAHIGAFYAGPKIWLLYGAMRDKSLDEIAGILSPVADHVILTNADSHRALRAEVLESLFEHTSLHRAASVAEGLAIARRAAPEDAVFVTGSLMVVGEARRILAG